MSQIPYKHHDVRSVLQSATLRLRVSDRGITAMLCAKSNQKMAAYASEVVAKCRVDASKKREEACLWIGDAAFDILPIDAASVAALLNIPLTQTDDGDPA